MHNTARIYVIMYVHMHARGDILNTYIRWQKSQESGHAVAYLLFHKRGFNVIISQKEAELCFPIFPYDHALLIFFWPRGRMTESSFLNTPLIHGTDGRGQPTI